MIVVITGDACCGKSKIIKRFVEDQFEEKSQATIGVEFIPKNMVLNDGTNIRLQIWDTAGSEKYRAITTGHYRNAVGAILVYDVSNEESFFNLSYWLENLREYADEHVVIALIPNKCDIMFKRPEDREVMKEQGMLFAKENHLLFIDECSALADINIKEVFTALIEGVYKVQSELIKKGIKDKKSLKLKDEDMSMHFSHRSLKNCLTNPDAVIDMDLKFFCSQAQADKSSAIKQLMLTFANDENEKLQKISFNSHIQSSQNPNSNLNISHIAGVLLYDLVKYNWQGILSDSERLVVEKQLIELQFENYCLRNLQARIVAEILIEKYPRIWEGLLEPIVEYLQSGETTRIDLSLRVLIFFIQRIEDEKAIKQFHEFVPKILPPLFSAFTNDEVDAHGREQVLEVLYLCLRTVSWADGIDNELVDNCLSETFNSWMALFSQIIQTNPKTFFDIKRNALKCMTVIFRDFINYSRDCINMILKPAWKLLNFHLPIFTEVLGYRNNQQLIQDGEEEPNIEQAKGFESEDEEEVYGVEGMTLQLIELLTTLISRQNVQEVVKQGIVPLITTVSSFMILPGNRERMHVGDYNHFIHDKDEDVYKARTIRNSCLDLISGLIEVFGDLAIESILFVVENLLLTPSAQSSSPTKLRMSEQSNVQTVEEVNIYEFSYSSSHKKHFWKKREVALYLIGSFAEDISMYRQRNQYNLKNLVEQIMKTDFSKAMLKSYLKGRTLWCATQLAEIMPRDYEELNNNVLNMAISFLVEENAYSVKLVATRCIIKFQRKIKNDKIELSPERFEQILDNLSLLLEVGSLDSIYLPIEAFTQYSRMNEEIVAQMAPKITPKLLKIFKTYHSEGQLGSELLNLFKIWTNYDKCRDIFVNTFIPFIMEIVENYYSSTANIDNKDLILQPQNPVDLSADKSSTTEQKQQNIVDSSILQHVLDLLCTLLKKTKNKKAEDFALIIDTFPKILEYVHKTEDMFLLLHGTATLKTFIHLGHKEVLKKVSSKEIIEVAKRLLQPTTNEQAALCLGNLVIQIFHKVEPKIDTNLLMSVVWKIYKSRMPSIVQSLVLIFARLIHAHPKEIVELLSETSIDNRISLKIVLDKWLLQQPLFRGHYTKNMTFSALLKLFIQRDPRIETLMVIGYNPSHSNINSEVNAPFKILSLMLRYLENELSPKKGKKPIPQNYEENDEEEEKQGITPGYKLRRDLLGEGERLDTVEGDEEDDYNSDRDEKGQTDKIEVNLDDVVDDDDNESLLGLSGKNNTGGNLFTIKESNDRGLADMETGSEVYMSELLAGFDMEDFDEAEEQNEEDLLELGDAFGNINLKNYIQDTLNDFIKKEKSGAEYVMYCVRQLPHDDQELAKRYLKFSKM